MRKLMNKIDRFCYAHPRFGIPNLMLIIVIGNAAVWLLTKMDTTGQIASLLCGSAQGILHGQVWRLVTYVFVPTEQPHLAAGDAVFLLLDRFVPRTRVGQRQIHDLLRERHAAHGNLRRGALGHPRARRDRLDHVPEPVDVFAFATLYPDMQVLLFFIIPIKVKYLAYVDAALFVLGVVTTSFPLNLLPVVAVLNYLVYCGDWLFDFFRPSHVRQRQKTVNFKREARRIQREQANKPYHYKCAVCGRTDVDHPELEFRYCSRCVGYHCFCQDHINNHVHFTE